MSQKPPTKRKRHESAEKIAIRAACEKRGLLGKQGERYATGGKERIARIHRKIGSFKSIFALGLEEL